MVDRIFDLEERTKEFAKQIVSFSNTVPRNIANDVLIRQIVRSGTSVGANYREANDSLSYKDFILRLRIARKEAKETLYWLEIIDANCGKGENQLKLTEANRLLQTETKELVKILSAAINTALQNVSREKNEPEH